MKLFVVGIGPGKIEYMSNYAIDVLKKVDYIVGYTKYIDRIKKYFNEKNFIHTGMRKEVERVKHAVGKVNEGYNVAIVSSGDSGVYGMASLAISLCENVEIVPGITAANSAAALLGAPLTLDFAVISMSDILVEWEKIVMRATYFAKSGVTTVIYNPISKIRKHQLKKVFEIFKKERNEFYIGIVKNAFLPNQRSYYIKSTSNIDWINDIDMMSIVFFCDENTIEKNNKIYVPRGYKQ
ncbi:precorrin-3B C(17)-methyltransferase [Tepiditoga spiralis]|uniref:Precorrin-3B C(17)-methyltransferase n=1 Tax=Tepiditoga spiralis TaxID=2108365 RepID=A0A7G1G9J0_9BACT|nr:precorrin-3B C(17)-methyltransferase [Tepiditoga spiralis]BBE31617.1 precorrin-3B C(17)-methyltransferase [Tepiditoga spiralis]